MDAIGTWTMLAAATGDLSRNVSICRPASPNAHSIVDLAILTFVVTGLIFVIVEGVLFYSVWRFRQPHGEPAGAAAGLRQQADRNRVDGGSHDDRVFPRAGHHANAVGRRLSVSPHPGDNALFVTVIGHQWWWEYLYESYDGRKLDSSPPTNCTCR